MRKLAQPGPITCPQVEARGSEPALADVKVVLLAWDFFPVVFPSELVLETPCLVPTCPSSLTRHSAGLGCVQGGLCNFWCFVRAKFTRCKAALALCGEEEVEGR